MNNTGREKLSCLLMSDFKQQNTSDQIGEEREVVGWSKQDGGGRLKERSQKDVSCLLNSVACLLSGAAKLQAGNSRSLSSPGACTDGQPGVAAGSLEIWLATPGATPKF